MGESIVAKRVYSNCPISLPNRVSYVDLVRLNILDFNIILGMDWFHACIAYIDCRTRAVRFNFKMNQLLSGRGEILFLGVASYLV